MTDRERLKPCPQCGEVPKIGYACGEYFIFSLSKPNFTCVCSSFFKMYASKKREIEEWNKYVETGRYNELR